jgi:hypothetical protein
MYRSVILYIKLDSFLQQHTIKLVYTIYIEYFLGKFTIRIKLSIHSSLSKWAPVTFDTTLSTF